MPYFQNALSYLLESLLGLCLIAVVLRFLFQLFRVDFRNPLVQIVVNVTNPPLRLLRKFIPGLYGIDLASVVLILLVGFIKTALVFIIEGYPFSLPGVLVISIARSIDLVVWVFIIVVLARVVLSWVAPHSSHPAARLVAGLSEPIMAPFRRVIPAIGGLDLSPILLFLALNLLQQLVVLPLLDIGRSLL